MRMLAIAFTLAVTGAGCSEDASPGQFELGPSGLSGLRVVADDGVIYATFAAPSGGSWFSATRTDGTVVTAPVRLDDTLLLPRALAVRGDRVMAATMDGVRALTREGVASTPAVPLPCPGSCDDVRVVPGPGDQFRIAWETRCASGSCTEARVLDHDGRPLTPAASSSGRLTSALPRAGEVTMVTTEQRFGAGGCPGCPRTAVQELDATGFLWRPAALPDDGTTASDGPDATDDGAQAYLAWHAFSTNSGGEHRVRLARWPTVIGEVPGAIMVRVAATGAGTGAIAVTMAEGGPAQLTRFRDQPGVPAVDLTAAHVLPSLPLALVAVDVDHVVAVLADGTATVYTLAP